MKFLAAERERRLAAGEDIDVEPDAEYEPDSDDSESDDGRALGSALMSEDEDEEDCVEIEQADGTIIRQKGAVAADEVEKGVKSDDRFFATRYLAQGKQIDIIDRVVS